MLSSWEHVYLAEAAESLHLDIGLTTVNNLLTVEIRAAKCATSGHLG